MKRLERAKVVKELQYLRTNRIKNTNVKAYLVQDSPDIMLR